MVEHCRGATDKAQRDPMGRSIHFSLGYLNFLERNELPSRIGLEGEIPSKNADQCRSEAQRKTWSPLTDIATEHYQPEHTRMGHNPQSTGEKYFIASRIDRIYSSLLPWQIINLKLKTQCVIEVANASEKCGSDHVPKQQKNRTSSQYQNGLPSTLLTKPFWMRQ